MFDGGEVQMSDVKQSEMDRLYARRETIWRRVIYTAYVAGPASGVGYALFGWKGIIPVACPWFLWVIWFLREDRRLTRAINAEQHRPATNHAYPVETPTCGRFAGHKPGQSDRSVSEPNGLTHRVSTRTLALALATVEVTSARGSFARRACWVSVAVPCPTIPKTRLCPHPQRFVRGPRWRSSSNRGHCNSGRVTS